MISLEGREQDELLDQVEAEMIDFMNEAGADEFSDPLCDEAYERMKSFERLRAESLANSHTRIIG